jgi:hypothetical protein
LPRARHRIAVPGGIGDDLGGLAANDVIVGAEIGIILRVARLAGAAAGIAVDDAPAGQAADIGIEWVAGR